MSDSIQPDSTFGHHNSVTVRLLSLPSRGMSEVRQVIEPTVEELLNDPIVGLLMMRDGLTQEAVRECIKDAKRKLMVREWHDHDATRQTARASADLVA